jgi:formylglycine-generating enzyme required for sulfatase activity
VSVGVALAFMLPAAPLQSIASAQGKPAAQKVASPRSAAPLTAFVQTLPGSVVKVEMAAIHPGILTLAAKKVSIKPFWIARTETTWEAFDAFMASGPPSPAYDQTKYAVDAIARPSKSYILPDLGWGHHGYPAINVSILSAQMFCRWLSAATGKKYRLPTEAEWEYACRAGAVGTGQLSPAELGKSAWFAGNSGDKTHPVAKKLPNAWGLYDMLGNVGEWATDADGQPVLCGGTFEDKADKVTPGARARQTPEWQATDPQLPKSRWWLADGRFVGFRIVREP